MCCRFGCVWSADGRGEGDGGAVGPGESGSGRSEGTVYMDGPGSANAQSLLVAGGGEFFGGNCIFTELFFYPVCSCVLKLGLIGFFSKIFMH